jgi:DNA-binding Lrp family transcriptional regulator
MLSSRFVAASLAGIVLAVSAPAASAAEGLTLTLPPPTGRYAVGESSFRLVDGTRPDPWVPAQPYRELMISVFHPAVHGPASPVANQFPAAVAAVAGGNLGLPAGLVDWASTKTHSVRDAAMAPGRFPVVLYSPGAGDPRDWNVSLVEDLASRGFVVVTVDHTGDGPAVQFPDGHVTGNGPLLAAWDEAYRTGTTPAFFRKLMDARTADTSLVLDRLASLPGGLDAGMDLRRIGMFGQSGGGFTAANMMYTDPRIKAVPRPHAGSMLAAFMAVDGAPAALLDAGLLGFDLDIDTAVLGIATRAMLWLSISPDRLDTVGRALADHAEVSFAAASTGAANLIASISCPDDAALYAYLTGKVAALQGVIDVETVPIVAAVKRHVSVDDAWVTGLSRR